MVDYLTFLSTIEITGWVVFIVLCVYSYCVMNWVSYRYGYSSGLDHGIIISQIAHEENTLMLLDHIRGGIKHNTWMN